TIIWVLTTFLTQPESKDVLRDFYQKIQPGGPGWAKVIDEARSENIEIVNDNEGWSVPSGIIAMLLGCVFIYSCLFATGYWIYGETTLAISITITAIVSGYLLKRTWGKIRAKVL
ncbi:MAG: Na+:solute symporter, partial [Polaribacter sp.]|nr:Na+:solute symporter [Polaribacter sp.]